MCDLPAGIRQGLAGTRSVSGGTEQFSDLGRGRARCCCFAHRCGPLREISTTTAQHTVSSTLYSVPKAVCLGRYLASVLGRPGPKVRKDEEVRLQTESFCPTLIEKGGGLVLSSLKKKTSSVTLPSASQKWFCARRVVPLLKEVATTVARLTIKSTSAISLSPAGTAATTLNRPAS